MQKPDLFDLILAVQEILGDELPIIAGSQASHALMETPPEIALQSIECDFLLFGGKADARDRINLELGIFSPFQVKHGYYADALGLATVVLPTGWQERLLPIYASDGRVAAQCISIYDLFVSKFFAGREKDRLFLIELLVSGRVEIGQVIDHLNLMVDSPYAGALADRLDWLIKGLQTSSVETKILEHLKRFKSSIK